MDQGAKQALLLGRESYRRGDYEGAEHYLSQVVERHDDYADVFDMLGVIAYRRGDLQRAERHFRRAVELNDDYTEAQLNLVVTCNELGRYDEARELYSNLCARRAGADSRGPGSVAKVRGEGRTSEVPPRPLNGFERGKIANLHAQTAQAYQDAGRLEEAIAELEKALRLGPRFVDLRVRLARLLRATGQLERAEDHYRKALRDNPDYTEAHLQLCRTLLDAGRPRDALEVLGRLRELAPDHPQALTYERYARRAL